MLKSGEIKTFIDARGKEVRLPPKPERIVSFICSVTETLFELGLDNRIIGRTNYCIHPAIKVEEVQKIGGPKNPDIDLILSMKPDLLIANIEENEKKDIEILEGSGIPVYVTYPRTVKESRDLIKILGEITGTVDKASLLCEKAGREIESVVQKVKTVSKKPRVVYLIWRKPFMTVNRDTYINDLIDFCGGINIFADSNDRYPVINLEEIIESKPDVIFFPSEPFPFKEKHTREFREFNEIPAVSNTDLRLVDGEMFSWFGYRIIPGLKYIFTEMHK
ncbi:MAG: cobalamin-binding protein [bacterium]|nr:cobalamin-binding protein [bacterium]